MRYFLLILFPLFYISAALAALGEHESSINLELMSRGASIKKTPHESYSLHEVRKKTLVVHQVAGKDGKIFAVTWKGKFLPDMKELMGSHYPQFQEAYQRAQQSHRGRGPLSIEVGNLHLEMGRMMGTGTGRAWLIDQVPSGVKTDVLQ